MNWKGSQILQSSAQEGSITQLKSSAWATWSTSVNLKTRQLPKICLSYSKSVYFEEKKQQTNHHTTKPNQMILSKNQLSS